MRKAFDALPEIIKKYGYKKKISVRRNDYIIPTTNEVYGCNKDTSWRIKGFYLGKKCISVIVYWQGDSTDGEEYITFTGSTTNNISLPPSEPINLGSRWVINRDGITITPSDIYEAIKGIKI